MSDEIVQIETLFQFNEENKQAFNELMGRSFVLARSTDILFTRFIINAL